MKSAPGTSGWLHTSGGRVQQLREQQTEDPPTSGQVEEPFFLRGTGRECSAHLCTGRRQSQARPQSEDLKVI